MTESPRNNLLLNINKKQNCREFGFPLFTSPYTGTTNVSYLSNRIKSSACSRYFEYRKFIVNFCVWDIVLLHPVQIASSQFEPTITQISF